MLRSFAKRFEFLVRRQSSRLLLAAPPPRGTGVAPWKILPSEATEERISNLISLIQGYFSKGGQHININCVTREKLVDAMAHPEKYPGLTIRVSGYAVHFHRLTREQQLDVINRQFHDTM